MTRPKYIVEILNNDEWEFISDHRNEENAVINSEILFKSRKRSTRVSYKGEFIHTNTLDIK